MKPHRQKLNADEYMALPPNQKNDLRVTICGGALVVKAVKRTTIGHEAMVCVPELENKMWNIDLKPNWLLTVEPKENPAFAG